MAASLRRHRARPLIYDKTGRQGFFVDQTRIISLHFAESRRHRQRSGAPCRRLAAAPVDKHLGLILCLKE